MDTTKFTGLKVDGPPSFKTELLYDDHKPIGPVQQMIAMRCGLFSQRYLGEDIPIVEKSIATICKVLEDNFFQDWEAAEIEDTIKWHTMDAIRMDEHGLHGYISGVKTANDLEYVTDYLQAFFGIIPRHDEDGNTIGYIGAWYSEKLKAVEFVRVLTGKDEHDKPYIIGDTPKCPADFCHIHTNILY